MTLRHAFCVVLFCALFAVIGVFGTVPARAAGTTANLSWVPATTNEDGSPLPAVSIVEHVIEWRRPGSTVLVGSLRVPMPATSVVANVVCGDYDFVAYTVVAGGVQSAASNPVRYRTAITCRPNPPSGLAAS
jgi:hypothetical protein